MLKVDTFLDGSLIDQATTWESCTYSWQNIYRKVERDWKMAYLCRAENTDSAEIAWKFNFAAEKLVIKSVSLVFDTKLYENGEIITEIQTNGQFLS